MECGRRQRFAVFKLYKKVLKPLEDAGSFQASADLIMSKLVENVDGSLSCGETRKVLHFSLANDNGVLYPGELRSFAIILGPG